MSVQRRESVRKVLSIEQKLEVLKEMDAGQKKKKDIAAQFKIPVSTLSTIVSHRDTITKLASRGVKDMKRNRKPEYPQLKE